MFKQRAISAVILVIIAAITLYFGGALTCLVMCAVSLIGVMELLRIYGLNKKGLGYAAYGATVFYYASVSYTHLDVYKRQIYNMVLTVQRTW